MIWTILRIGLVDMKGFRIAGDQYDRGRFSESGAVVTMRDDVELDNLDNIFL